MKFLYYFTFSLSLNFITPASLSLSKREDCKLSSLTPTIQGNPYYSILPLDACPVCPETNNCNECKVKVSDTFSVRNTRFWSKILLGFTLPKDRKIKKCTLSLIPVENQQFLSSNTLVDVYTTTSFNADVVTWDNSPKDNDLISTFDTKNPNPIDITKYCQGGDVYFSIVKNDTIGPENISFYSATSQKPPKLEVEYESP
ncbi:hypothetical protein K502DRAFT_361293 [Neoconidiobolus thromboides FSU 785]|nr:hypothetical protein K502DRAFT_361293 [Neoconidiobolus thromboides FSU 785]